MLKTSLRGMSFALFLLSFLLTGCGVDGSDAPSTPVGVPTLHSSSMNYDFGDVTLLNSPAEKMINFSNRGNAPLTILSIELTSEGFDLNLGSGAIPCGSASTTIAAGGSCTVAIGFAPNTAGNYSGMLTVRSNDPTTRELAIQIAGTGLAVAEQIVHINQVVPDTCSSSELTAYISVTDQAGYPIPGLTMSNFALAESSNSPSFPMPIQSIETVETVSAPISVTLVMDYSDSVTRDPAVQAAMEDGVISFISQLGANDEVEIVKFDTTVEVVQPFTAGNAAGKSTLIAKVKEAWDMGIYTRVYDAVYRAVTDTATRQTERRGVIVLSDFDDNPGEGNTSDSTLNELLAQAIASGVPIYTVGIGVELDSEVGGVLATDTGGQYSDATSADNMRTIYLQLAKILFVDQYVLSYASVFETGDSATLTAGVRLDGQNTYVYDSLMIVPCP